jgi:hypothetical protein
MNYLQCSLLSATVLMAVFSGSSHAVVVEDFNRSNEPGRWRANEEMCGKNGWEQLRYYGEVIEGARISGNGQGWDGSLRAGVGAAALPVPGGPYVSGTVTCSAMIENSTAAVHGKSRLLLGTRNLLGSVGTSSHNDAVWIAIDGENGTTIVYSDETSDPVAFLSTTLPAGISEIEIQVDLDNDTANVGFYELDQATLGRASPLRVLGQLANVDLPEVAALGFYTDVAAVPAAFYEIKVDHATPVPESSTLALLGLIAFVLRRRRKQENGGFRAP